MNKKVRKLPEGMFNKKQFILYILSMLLYLGVAPFLTLSIVTRKNIYSIIAIFYVIVACFVIITLTHLLSPLYKIEKNRNRSGDVKKFIEDIQLLKSDKVKDETLNYLDILLVNAYFNVDLNKANELFSKIKKPTVKKYALIYQLVEVCYYINNEQYNEARNSINLYSSVNPKIKKTSLLIDVFEKADVKIDNIEKIYPINKKNNVFVNVNNAITLLTYYKVRNNIDKANEYASFILKQNTTMDEVNKLAKNTLEGD